MGMHPAPAHPHKGVCSKMPGPEMEPEEFACAQVWLQRPGVHSLWHVVWGVWIFGVCCVRCLKSGVCSVVGVWVGCGVWCVVYDL